MASEAQYSSHMKHVWHSSMRAATGTLSGPASSTFVGQASTQRLQPVQRSLTINSNMGGLPSFVSFEPRPHFVEAADEQPARLSGALSRGVCALVHAAAFVAGKRRRVTK